MRDTWASFLSQQGAIIENGVVRHFGNPPSEVRAAHDANVVIDLSSLSLIRMRGADARTFLNGQLTNDVNLADPGRSQLSAWCTAQGRMLAVFRIFLRGADLYLQLPALLRDDTIKRLQMFVLRAKVAIENADAELVRLGFVGPTADALLRNALGRIPAQDDACVSEGDVSALRLPGLHSRFEIVCPPAQAMTLWSQLRKNAAPAGASAWAWHDIMAGIPTVHPQTKEEFVPQMANLELLGGVNFKKGCYPGQEIVARMQYLGRLKQRMYRAHVAGNAPMPGARIHAPALSGQSAGTVVDAQPSPEGGADLLAVIQTAVVPSAKLYLGSEAGPALEIRSLPYALPATA